jgi:hypothetical protein
MARNKLARRAWHYFVQTIFLFAKQPSIHLTESAKLWLLDYISSEKNFELVASPTWASTIVGDVAQEPRWMMGFYDIGTRPSGKVTLIQGVPFVFADPRAYTHLDGATVDIRDGRLVVTERELPR